MASTLSPLLTTTNTMAAAAAFHYEPVGEDEMDQDHFNELDKIFDLPYADAHPDPFTAASQHPHHYHHHNGSSHDHSHRLHHPSQQHHPYHYTTSGGGGERGHDNGGSGPGVGEWHVKEEDASYHTAVDASFHVDLSSHHVDSSNHHVDISGHGTVDASGHDTASMMDGSGHDSLIDLSGHGGFEPYDYGRNGGLSGEPKFMDHSCEACKRSKKRCNRRNPCQICSARGIKCVPQVRGPGRPPGSKSRSSSSNSLSSIVNHQSRSKMDFSGRNGLTLVPPSSLHRSVSASHLQQQIQQQQQQQRLPIRDPWHCRFFFEAARHCKEAFLKAWHDNELDEAKCILLRNLWSRSSTRIDVTFGICEQIQEAIGPMPVVPPAQSPTTRSRSSAAQQAQNMTNPGSNENMGTWCLPEDLRKLDDGCSMVVAYLHVNDEFFVHTNDAFTQVFMSGEEIMNKVDTAAVLPILLLAEIFHPDDLPDVYASIGTYWFRKKPHHRGSSGSETTQEASWICKCVDKQSTEFLAMIRFRHFQAPPEGYPGAAILSVRRLQQSKYLCDPDASRMHQMQTRIHRETLGALPTMEVGDAFFRPLRRGMSVLSTESSGPQPVPGRLMEVHVNGNGTTSSSSSNIQQQQQQLQQRQQQEEHQASWNGFGIAERMLANQQAQHHHQQQQQQQEQAMLDEMQASVADSTLDATRLLEHSQIGGTDPITIGTAPGSKTNNLSISHHHEMDHSRHSQHSSSNKQLDESLSGVPQVSPDGFKLEEEDGTSVGTDFDRYGSSPSPEPAHLSHLSSPALYFQARKAGGGGQYGGDGEVTVVGSSSGSRPTDLDISCHGPHDPNGYGGLQWSGPSAAMSIRHHGGDGGGGVGGSPNGKHKRRSGSSRKKTGAALARSL